MGPPVASSARELFMLGGSWGYGPAGIPYGPSRIWVIGVSPHRTGRWWGRHDTLADKSLMRRGPPDTGRPGFLLAQAPSG